MRMYQDERRFDFHGLGLALKQAREEKGWTQAYVAELVGKTDRTIRLYYPLAAQLFSFPLKLLLKRVFLPADSATFPLSLKIQMKRAFLPAVPCITINPSGGCSTRCAELSDKFSLISCNSGGRGNDSANRMKISPYSLQTMKRGK